MHVSYNEWILVTKLVLQQSQQKYSSFVIIFPVKSGKTSRLLRNGQTGLTEFTFVMIMQKQAKRQSQKTLCQYVRQYIFLSEA